MLKRILAVFVAAAMAMGLTPAMAYATPENDAGGGVTLSSSAPTAKGSEFYANGTPIEITAQAPAGGDSVSFDGFEAGGTNAYISWEDDGSTKYVGVGEKVFVFGGSDGSNGPVSVESTSIYMTGGTVSRIYGGNSGSQSNGEENCSKVTGNVHIGLFENAVVTDMVVGGGRYNASVAGRVDMDFDGVDLSDESTKCYVMGGVHGNGNEGTRNIDEGTMDTAAVVGSVQINAQNSNFYLITAGGGGSTKVEYADVFLYGESSSDYVYAGGINGEVVESHILIEGSSVDEFAATNRGFVGTCYFTANSAQIGKLYMGATPGCFGSDSGGHDGSGVTVQSFWTIDGGSNVGDAVLTPLVKRDGSNYSSIVNTMSITKTGKSMDVALGGFTPVDGTTLGETAVSEYASLGLSNVKMSVESGHALTNAGSIEAIDGGSIVVEGGATFKNAGTVKGDVEEEEGAVVEQCAARLGSTGYDTLQDAIDAAAERADGDDGEDRVTLLKNVNENIDIPAGKRIYLDLNGFTLTNASGHTITNYGTLTVDDLVGGGVVDNVTHGKGALVNHGTVTVYGGTFTRSEEASTNPTDNGGNSWYVIDNQGTMTFVGGEVVNDSKFSSLVRNLGGYLTIIDGTFKNDFIALKNDEKGTLVVEGGTVTSVEQSLQNWSEATLSGGTFNGRVATWGYTGTDVGGDNTAIGKTTITGSAVVNGDVQAINYMESEEPPSVTVSGGTVNGNVMKATHVGNGTKWAEPDVDTSTIVVTGGSFKAEGTNGESLPHFMAEGTVAKSENDSYIAMERKNLEAGDYIVPEGTDGISDKDLAPGFEVVKNEDGTFTVVEPSTPVTPPAKPSYDVAVDQPANGTVELSAKTAKEGQKVTITVKPDAGFELASLVVADEDGNALKLELSADGTYSFEMPAGDVTVHAAFECDGGELCPSHGFTDVDQSQWYHAAIDWAVDNDVLQGVGDGLMLPDGDITRAQMAQVLWNVEGQPAASEGAGFSDVSDGDWFAGAVAWASQEGIFVGYDGAFDPGSELTREQAAAVLMRWAESNGDDVSGRADLSGFPDADGISEWAVESVRWAVDAGVLQGVANPDGTTTVSAQGTATRAQVAALMMRLEGQRTA